MHRRSVWFLRPETYAIHVAKVRAHFIFVKRHRAVATHQLPNYRLYHHHRELMLRHACESWNAHRLLSELVEVHCARRSAEQNQCKPRALIRRPRRSGQRPRIAPPIHHALAHRVSQLWLHAQLFAFDYVLAEQKNGASKHARTHRAYPPANKTCWNDHPLLINSSKL